MKILHLLGQCSPALGVTALAQIRIHQLLIYGVWMEKRASHCRLSPYPITRNLSEQGRGPIPRSSYDELTLVCCCSFSRFFCFCPDMFSCRRQQTSHVTCPYLYFAFSYRLLSSHSLAHIWGDEALAFNFLEDPITFGNRWDLANQDIRVSSKHSWEGRHTFFELYQEVHAHMCFYSLFFLLALTFSSLHLSSSLLEFLFYFIFPSLSSLSRFPLFNISYSTVFYAHFLVGLINNVCSVSWNFIFCS